MKKQFIIIICLILIITTFLNGCQESESIKTNENKKIFFESNIVELKDSDIIFHKDEGRIVRVEVNYLFKKLVLSRASGHITGISSSHYFCSIFQGSLTFPKFSFAKLGPQYLLTNLKIHY